MAAIGRAGGGGVPAVRGHPLSRGLWSAGQLREVRVAWEANESYGSGAVLVVLALWRLATSGCWPVRKPKAVRGDPGGDTVVDTSLNLLLVRHSSTSRSS